MKKVFVMVVASMLMATTAMAGEKNDEMEKTPDFSLSINQRSLDRLLMMDDDQKAEMEFASRRLEREVKKARKEDALKQSVKLRKAVGRNLQVARRVLYRNQYRDYVSVLNFTLNNKGLAPLMEQADLAQK